MPGIGFEDFFDPSMPEDIRRTAEEIMRLRKVYEDFANQGIADQLERLGIKQSELVKTILALSEGTKQLNVTNKTHQETLLKQQQVIDDLVTRYELLKKTKEGVKNVVNNVNDSVNALTQRLKEQVAEWKKLSESQDTVRMKQVAQDIANTRNQIKSLTDTTRASNAAIIQTKGSYNELSKATQELISRYKALDNAQGSNRLQARALASQIKDNTAQLRKMDDAIDQNWRKQNSLTASFGGLRTSMIGVAATYISLRALVSAFNELIDTAVKFESLGTALKAISDNTADLAASQNFILTIADRYGQNIETLTHSYIGLSAATKNTSVEGAATKKVFEAVVAAGSALKLSNSAVEGSLLAVQQMFSKGTVQAEELRKQLAERLPGSFRIMAEALGVSEVQLNKMLKAGDVLAKDVLPKFAQRLQEVYGKSAIENSHALVNETNRLTNAFNLFLVQFANTTKITTFWGEMKRGLSTFFNDLTYYLQHSDKFSFFNFFKSTGEGKNAITEARLRQEALQQAAAEFELKTPTGRGEQIQSEQLALEGIRKQATESTKKEAEARKVFEKEQTQGSAVRYAAAKKEGEANRELLTSRQNFVTELTKINLRLTEQEKINLERTTEPDTEKADKKRAAEEHKREVAARHAEEELRRAQRAADELAKQTAREAIATEEFKFVAGGGGDYQATIELEKRKLDILEKSYAIRFKIYKADSAEYKGIAKEKLDAEREFQLKVQKLTDEGLKNKAKLAVAELEFKYEDKTGVENVDKFEKEKMVILDDYYDQRLALYKKDSDEYNKILTEKVDAERKSGKAILKAQLEDRAEQRAVQEKYSELVDTQDAGAIHLAVAKGSLTDAEGEEALHKIRQSRMQDAISQKQIEIDAMKNKDKEYYDAKKALLDLEKNLDKENSDFQIQQAERTKQAKIDKQQAYIYASEELAQALLSLGSGIEEAQIQQLTEQKDKELEIAGSNAAAKAKIEEKFQKDVAKLRRRQAIFDKLSAAFNIGLHLEETIMKNNAEFGVPAAIPLNIIAGFEAAAALALVLAKQPPSYEKGRKGGKKEWARINEDGAEFIKHNGEYNIVAKGKETITVIPEGADVIPARQTRKILEERIGAEYVDSLINGALSARDYEETAKSSYIRQLAAAGLTEEGLGRKFRDAVTTIPISQTIFDEKGFTKFWKNKHSRIEDLNSRNSLGGKG